MLDDSDSGFLSVFLDSVCINSMKMAWKNGNDGDNDDVFGPLMYEIVCRIY